MWTLPECSVSTGAGWDVVDIWTCKSAAKCSIHLQESRSHPPLSLTPSVCLTPDPWPLGQALAPADHRRTAGPPDLTFTPRRGRPARLCTPDDIPARLELMDSPSPLPIFPMAHPSLPGSASSVNGFQGSSFCFCFPECMWKWKRRFYNFSLMDNGKRPLSALWSLN